MKVYVACYQGTDTEEILGVFTDIEKARESIYKDYKSTEIGYDTNLEVTEDNRIYVAQEGMYYDEWLVVETELYN